MTIRLATAVTGRSHTRLSRAQARAAIARPANDNCYGEAQDAMLHAALHQFAKHGIGAAEHARQQAERAFFKGDRETYQWWLGICRLLDRRLSTALALANERE
jgi:hypothetical protein